MADNPPCSIPAAITAGDTAIWRRELADYPASAGWTLAYTLVSATKVFNVTAAADGDAFLVTVLATTTTGWDVGTYKVAEYVSNGAERHTLSYATVQVQPNLAAATAGLDIRSHAQIVLDSINGWLESKAPVYGTMEINGRKISYYPLNELLALRDRYQRDVNREQRLANGGGPGRRVLAVL